MKKFNPDVYVKNIYNIDYEKIKQRGIKLICFDLDNTLDEPDSLTVKKDDKLHEFLEELKKEFDILIVSNNTIKNRVSSFANIYNLNYIEAMRKPFQKKYNNEIITNYSKDNIIFVGDKIVTDVLGASRFGSYSVLVDPLFPKSKKWYSKIMHFFDKFIYLFSSVRYGKYFDNL